MNAKWWKAAGIRALKTVCQTAVATIGTSAILSEVNWIAVASASALAGILSLLTSVAGLPEVKAHEPESVAEIFEDDAAADRRQFHKRQHLPGRQ